MTGGFGKKHKPDISCARVNRGAHVVRGGQTADFEPNVGHELVSACLVQKRQNIVLTFVLLFLELLDLALKLADFALC